MDAIDLCRMERIIAGFNHHIRGGTGLYYKTMNEEYLLKALLSVGDCLPTERVIYTRVYGIPVGIYSLLVYRYDVLSVLKMRIVTNLKF